VFKEPARKRFAKVGEKGPPNFGVPSSITAVVGDEVDKCM